VVGSAQRKYRGALMQHGGILLARSPYTPTLPGIRELSGRMLTVDEVASAVRAEFTHATGWRGELGDWTAAERELIAERVATKYGQASWNGKR
jgi:lipoate-protein ligase A